MPFGAVIVSVEVQCGVWVVVAASAWTMVSCTVLRVAESN